VLHTTIAGDYTAYVRPVMRIPLLAAAVVLVVAGAAGAATGLAARAAGHHHAGPDDDGHGHHGRVPPAALLALVPLAVLALVQPPALDDGATDSVAPAAAGPAPTSGPVVEPLPGDPDTPRAMSFGELAIRAAANGGPASLKGRMLVVEGFVAKSQSGAPTGTVRVGRYRIWCCAADATFGAAIVRWPEGTPRPAPGSWFRITGRVTDVVTAGYVATPTMDARHVRAVPAPRNHYEY
jgi:uncharacterized repeat protein (TIGR03943 family)